ncbi:MAG: ATP-binding protein [Bacteroidetes bacterium]|nr:ATP-binding protein [Bacteroidota bacterium]MBU1719008.1 ATP-binding protein [Bacteroidota bacterium]
MNKETLIRVILENQDIAFAKEIISRNIHIPQTENITVLTGIRRCGKTYTLYELAKKYERTDILFLDFEDERLVHLNLLDDYDIILDSYFTVYPEKTPVIFFDEVQNLKNWHLYLRRLHNRGFKIFVTGSNANMLSREIATQLKGKSLETRIFTFSFPEFLRLKNTTFSEKDKRINQPRIQNRFSEYMMFGAFPEVIKAAEVDKRAVADNIYSMLFYKDLVAKFGKEEYLLKLIVSKIAENVTKEFSISSLAKKIISVYPSSIPTITEYFNILQEPYLTASIYPFRESFVQRQAKRKTYLTDNSFIFLNRISEDKSRLFENLVFQFLERTNNEVFYYRTNNGQEVDFLVRTQNKQTLIQACSYPDNADTLAREIKAIIAAMNELRLSSGIIYTIEAEGEEIIGGKKVEIIPLWRAMLAGI